MGIVTPSTYWGWIYLVTLQRWPDISDLCFTADGEAVEEYAEQVSGLQFITRSGVRGPGGLKVHCEMDDADGELLVVHVHKALEGNTEAEEDDFVERFGMNRQGLVLGPGGGFYGPALFN